LPDQSATAPSKDIAALAKGGRTNFFGFLLRLAARLPFLFIAGRLYGPENLGRFASAVIVVEFAAQLATLGQKRGLAQQLARGDEDPACVIADGLLLSLAISAILALVLWLFPLPLFPSGNYDPYERLLPLVIFPIAAGDIALAALAYRYDIGATVRARSIVEPWTLSIAAGVFYFITPADGLILSYFISMTAAMVTALVPLVKSYGLPHGWKPHPLEIGRQAVANLPIAGADMVESGTRKLDIALLGAFAPPSVVGVYYVAQQIASLPQKLRTSFEPILGPVITRNLAEGNMAAIAKQVCQVGFWITAAQAGIALALGIPGPAVMGLVGPNFVGGTGAVNFLLLAEVVAATAVVSEAALIYLAPLRNLLISLAMIVLQGALTVALVLTVRSLNLPPLWSAAAAAAALMLSLALSSVAKALLLGRILQRPINNWRWALVWACAPAVLVGWGVRQLPEWAQLAFGIPAILGIYGFVIWRRGFGPEDRVLFRREAAAETAPASSTA
jgi:O-antigen/teichoic acid export membrane protein